MATDVQRYGCIPSSAANNLGEIQKSWELQISCFEEFLGGENDLGLVLLVSLTLWDTPVLFTPPLPLPQHDSGPGCRQKSSLRKLGAGVGGLVTPSGTESPILLRKLGDPESCDSNRAIPRSL